MRELDFVIIDTSFFYQTFETLQCPESSNGYWLTYICYKTNSTNFSDMDTDIRGKFCPKIRYLL